MPAPTSGIIRRKWGDDYQTINSRRVTIIPSNFEISSDEITWWDLTSFGNLTNLVNCTDVNSTVSTLSLMINPNVSFFSFKLDNDTSGTVFTMYCKDSLALPNLSITRVKAAIGSNSTNLSVLNTSSAINLASPRFAGSSAYNPNGATLPSTVGRPTKNSPYSLGEWIGYCHTASAGFTATDWNNITVSYNSNYGYYNRITKAQIPVVGDSDTSKWNNIKIVYPTQTFSNLNFNQIFTHINSFTSTVNTSLTGWTESQSIRIYYDDTNLIQTLTRTVTYEGRNSLMSVTFTATSSSAATKRIYVSLSITNAKSTTLPINSTFTLKCYDANNVATTVRTLGSIATISGNATATLTGYAAWSASDFLTLPIEGDTLNVNVYRDGEPFENTYTTLGA